MRISKNWPKLFGDLTRNMVDSVRLLPGPRVKSIERLRAARRVTLDCVRAENAKVGVCFSVALKEIAESSGPDGFYSGGHSGVN